MEDRFDPRKVFNQLLLLVLAALALACIITMLMSSCNVPKRYCNDDEPIGPYQISDPATHHYYIPSKPDGWIHSVITIEPLKYDTVCEHIFVQRVFEFTDPIAQLDLDLHQCICIKCKIESICK